MYAGLFQGTLETVSVELEPLPLVRVFDAQHKAATYIQVGDLYVRTEFPTDGPSTVKAVTLVGEPPQIAPCARQRPYEPLLLLVAPQESKVTDLLDLEGYNPHQHFLEPVYAPLDGDELGVQVLETAKTASLIVMKGRSELYVSAHRTDGRERTVTWRLYWTGKQLVVQTTDVRFGPHKELLRVKDVDLTPSQRFSEDVAQASQEVAAALAHLPAQPLRN
jgi:hypothetical protein